MPLSLTYLAVHAGATAAPPKTLTVTFLAVHAGSPTPPPAAVPRLSVATVRVHAGAPAPTVLVPELHVTHLVASAAAPRLSQVQVRRADGWVPEVLAVRRSSAWQEVL